MITIRAFIVDYLIHNKVGSDIEIMDAFARRHCITLFKRTNYGMLAKKLESVRKILYSMKCEGTLEEVSRTRHYTKSSNNNFFSDEILYILKK